MIKANLIYKYFIMKNLENLGTALSKAEQRSINGGTMYASCADLYPHRTCPNVPIHRCIDYCGYAVIFNPSPNCQELDCH
ncbi:hypothetical protein [Mesoflavibacter zeaxanthinifaciens]|uniref:hypothetical protein n=1 Tax=Mesoflavibacter zeaxanthinifaciens TaxID=393060 RepID=UPI003A9563C3